jgi:hypothetical protein
MSIQIPNTAITYEIESRNLILCGPDGVRLEIQSADIYDFITGLGKIDFPPNPNYASPSPRALTDAELLAASHLATILAMQWNAENLRRVSIGEPPIELSSDALHAVEQELRRRGVI